MSISIIALLTAVAVVSFGGVNKKARDSKRSADLEKIRIALEGYRQINGSYPASLSDLVTDELLQVLPTDPKTAGDYCSSLNDYSYCLGSSMEDVGSTNTIDCSGACSSSNYRMTNP